MATVVCMGALDDSREIDPVRSLSNLAVHAEQKGYDDLLATRLKLATRKGKIRTMEGVFPRDAYNPSIVETGSRTVLAARVESKLSEWHDPARWDPQVRFFVRNRQRQFVPLRGAPVFDKFEDPYATWITDTSGRQQLLLAAVTLDRTMANPTSPGLNQALADPIPVTKFFMAPSIEELDPSHPIATIYGMKDGFRVIQCPDGSLLMATRPADGRVGENVLGLLRLPSITDVNANVVVRDSTLLNTGLDPGTFIAVNQMQWVKRSPDSEPIIGAMGCISRDVPGKGWQFAPVVWLIDPKRMIMSRPVVIAERADFPKGSPKYPDLADVLFPGSLVRSPNGLAHLWTGVSDAQIGELVMKDPFTALGYPVGELKQA
ncbi:MAG: DUF1861 family protein [Candidatus Dormibacteria bacterium]